MCFIHKCVIYTSIYGNISIDLYICTYFSALYFAERNLNPKAACLKRREEEKGDEIPGGRGMSADDIAAQQAALAGKVRNMLLPLLADDFDDMDC